MLNLKTIMTRPPVTIGEEGYILSIKNVKFENDGYQATCYCRRERGAFLTERADLYI